MAVEINCVCNIDENNVKVCYPPTSIGGGVQSVVAGTNVTVDDTDPANPIVSASGGVGITGVGTVDYIPRVATIDGLGNIVTVGDSHIQSSTYGLNAAIVSEFGQINWGVEGTAATSVIQVLENKIILNNVPTAGGGAQFYLEDGDIYLQSGQVPLTSVGYLTMAADGKVGVEIGLGAVKFDSTLTGLSITGGSINTGTTVIEAFGQLQNQINGILGGAVYQGVWNATTNIPTLSSGVGTAGYYYVVSVAGSTNLDGITDWKIGDWAIFNGTTWDKVDNTDAVSSVNGAIGAVVVTTTGTTNRITVSGGSGLTPTIDISSSYIGQSSITTVGTLSSGAVPASLVTAGTFGAGAYTMGTSLATPSLIGVNGVQAYSTTAQSSGAITDFTFTPSNHTGQTASTNSPVFKIAASTKTLAAGAVSAFYGTSIESTTVSFVSASTITNGYNLFVDSFPTGTSATVTNPYSIGTNGFIRIAAGSTTQGTIIRNDTTANYAAIYNGNVTPSNLNFALKYNGNTTFVNGATGGSLFLTYNAGSVVNISSATAFGFADGVNVSTGTTTGTKFGTATSQKIAFFNKTPIIQPTTGITGATLVGGGGTTITSTDTFGGYTLQQLAAVIINLGLAA